MIMTSFHERQKNLFNQLKDAEEQIGFSKTNKAAPQDYGTVDRITYRKLKSEMKQFRGRESIYKRPEANLRECLRARTIPDYMKNPQKYVYYSLADVTPEQMSDSTNTATAVAFIQEMEERNAANIKTEQGSDEVVFKKPTFHMSVSVKKEKLKSEDQERATFKSSKVIMPEYVVGASKKKEKKSKSVRRPSSDASEAEKKAELKLNHLFEDEED